MSIGDNVRQLRIARQMTQQELADGVGIKQPTVAQIERGTKALSLALAMDMAIFFGCSLDCITGNQTKDAS